MYLRIDEVMEKTGLSKRSLEAGIIKGLKLYRVPLADNQQGGFGTRRFLLYKKVDVENYLLNRKKSK